MAVFAKMITTVLPMLLFAVLIVDALPTRSHDKHSMQQCLQGMKKSGRVISKENLVQFCKFYEGWVQSASQKGKTHSKITEAQIEFMKSLASEPGMTASQPISQNVNDWPYIPATSKPRKEYRMLTAEERQRFHDAVNVLKNFYIDDQNNVYDTFERFHYIDQSPAAHFGPNFLGWHREYLHRFEKALQLVDPDVTIPYWDTRMDSEWGPDNAADTMMWTEECLGNKFGDVTIGPFKNWRLYEPFENRDYLWRGERPGRQLFGDEEYNYVVSTNNFRNLTLFVDPFFEPQHGLNHAWVGGVMGGLDPSPSDPTFFLHHCFIDFIWYQQQARVFQEIGRQDYFYPREDDLEAYGIGTPSVNFTDPSESAHFYDNPMWPFTEKKNYEGLSDYYFLYSYYDNSPTCNEENPSCGSSYLFCAQGIGKCVPKLQAGANCADFAEYDSCYDSQCIDGTCTTVKKNKD